MPDRLTKMMEISEPHLVERYGRALAAFGLKMPELEQFSIDLIGFSPEIADALGDQDYLDPKRVNRRFIILSPEQRHLELLHASFSNTHDLMLEFFEKNKRVLYALTLKDVVFGEIEDNVHVVNSLDDLLAIEEVQFKIGTHENLTEKTSQLQRKMERLRKEPNSWRDHEMLSEMVELAKVTGDIRENKLLPEAVVFHHDTFWSSHFDGTYVFHDGKSITVICDPAARGFRRSRPWQVGYLDIGKPRSVFDFLNASGRIQPPLGSWIERSTLLQTRKYLAAVWLADKQGDELPSSLDDTAWYSDWCIKNAGLIEDDNTIPVIEWAEEQVGEWDNIDIGEVEEDLRFVLCRGEPDHPDIALVNQLVSEFVLFDIVTLYEFNRAVFFREREKWSPPYREFVETVIEKHYVPNRDDLYTSLYSIKG